MKVAVIGGGAAGFFAAVNLAEKNRTAKITIFEAAHRPLQKVFISGGGRCNVTHACFDPQRLTEFYPRGQKELRSLFARFQPQDTVRWFERHGLKLKTEADGRMFPVSDESQDVIDVLLETARLHRVQILTQARVEGVMHRNGQFLVKPAGRQEQVFDKVILATGYSPPGWKLAEQLGHRVLPPVPSLFPFTVKSPVIAGLQGIALERVQGKLQTGDGKKYQAEGPVLVTHTGLSGPVIYRLSAWGARSLAESRYTGQLQLDFFPDLKDDELREQLSRALQQEAAKKKLANTHFAHLPSRLWLSLLGASEAPLEERGEVLGKKALNKLVENLKRLSLPVSGKSPSKEEFVSCGGVPLKEVDFKTMESRIVPGLYFGGEILDIDGLTGGFNFQACWSEGWVISEALAGN